jgi:hypothetical protein
VKLELKGFNFHNLFRSKELSERIGLFNKEAKFAGDAFTCKVNIQCIEFQQKERSVKNQIRKL